MKFSLLPFLAATATAAAVALPAVPPAAAATPHPTTGAWIALFEKTPQCPTAVQQLSSLGLTPDDKRVKYIWDSTILRGFAAVLNDEQKKTLNGLPCLLTQEADRIISLDDPVKASDSIAASA